MEVPSDIPPRLSLGTSPRVSPEISPTAILGIPVRVSLGTLLLEPGAISQVFFYSNSLLKIL